MFGFSRRRGAVRPQRTYRSVGDTGVAGQPLEPRLLLSTDVLTYHNDSARTGANLSETTLTPANVDAFTFGKTGQAAVDGAVYAQPLIKTNLFIPGKGIHNVVYVATEHNSVYAFDADTLAPLWQTSFTNPAAGITPVPDTDVENNDIGPEVGITGTPVIDPVSRTLYVVTKLKISNAAGVAYDQQLHALDLATGAEKFGGPVSIRASVPGNGDGSVNGQVAFDPLRQNQRAALTLSRGVVYVAFAGHGVVQPYHGWVIGFNARTLKQVFALNTTPNGGAGGVWMSGDGPAADATGSIYFSTGNGTFDASNGNRGDSVLKLNQAGGVVDSFTPLDQKNKEDFDLDLGSGGVMLLPDQPGPHRRMLVMGDKGGNLYLLNRDNLGGYSTTANNVVQQITRAVPGDFDTPAYFNGNLYMVGAGVVGANVPTGQAVANPLKAFSLSNGVIDPNPETGTVSYGYPGATPSVSARGATNGVVWTIDRGEKGGPRIGILRAYDASNVSHVLYDSTQAGDRDQGGGYVKFSVPTVANGKVYVGGNGTLTTYGLLAPQNQMAKADRQVIRPRLINRGAGTKTR